MTCHRHADAPGVDLCPDCRAAVAEQLDGPPTDRPSGIRACGSTLPPADGVRRGAPMLSLEDWDDEGEITIVDLTRRDP